MVKGLLLIATLMLTDMLQHNKKRSSLESNGKFDL
jgi:hypothetical protein